MGKKITYEELESVLSDALNVLQEVKQTNAALVRLREAAGELADLFKPDEKGALVLYSDELIVKSSHLRAVLLEPTAVSAAKIKEDAVREILEAAEQACGEEGDGSGTEWMVDNVDGFFK